MIYNLWFNDDGSVELDFDTDPEVNNSCHSVFFFLNVVKCNVYHSNEVASHNLVVAGYSY